MKKKLTAIAAAAAILLSTGTTGFAVGLEKSTLPDSYDARDYGLVTAVKQQEYQGACWAFATVSALESAYISEGFGNNLNTDFSEAYLIWNGHNTKNETSRGEGWNDSNVISSGGGWANSVSALKNRSGIANESKYPYADIVSGKNIYMCNDTELKTVLEEAVSFGSTEIGKVKDWISENGSVTASIFLDEKYIKETSNGTAAYCGKDLECNHEVSVIGWDDNYSANNFKSKPSKNGAWLCKNSWGSEWGDGGYFWLSYYDNTIEAFSGYSVRALDKNETDYSYNATACSSYVPIESGSKMANVFTAENDEILKAIAVSTVDGGIDAEIEIYTSIPENAPLSEGNLVLSQNCRLENKGYHTIELSETIELEAGSRFAVAIKMESKGETVNLPIESGGDIFTSEIGESFLCYDGKTWKDLQSFGLNNAYIDAFTVRECDTDESSGTESLPENEFNDASKTEAEKDASKDEPQFENTTDLTEQETPKEPAPGFFEKLIDFLMSFFKIFTFTVEITV